MNVNFDHCSTSVIIFFSCLEVQLRTYLHDKDSRISLSNSTFQTLTILNDSIRDLVAKREDTFSAGHTGSQKDVETWAEGQN